MNSLSFLLQVLSWPWRCREAWMPKPLWRSSFRHSLRERSSSSVCHWSRQRWRVSLASSPCLACLSSRGLDWGFKKLTPHFAGVLYTLLVYLLWDVLIRHSSNQYALSLLTVFQVSMEQIFLNWKIDLQKYCPEMIHFSTVITVSL